MGASPTARLGLVRTLLAEARLAARLLRDPAVPAATKLVVAGAALYLIWPIDLLPDLIPLLGQLDDVGVLLAAVQGLIHLCPGEPVAFHRAALAAGRRYSPTPRTRNGFIDADFRRDPS